MKIEDEFRVDVPIDEAWKVLLDVERIAPCMPGAQLQEIEGDEYRGIVKIKVGPITAQYKGAARIVEADESAHTGGAQGRGPRHARSGQRVGHGHRHAHARGQRHGRAHRHRPQHHGQGRAVRSRRDGRRVEQAARAVRVEPRARRAERQRCRGRSPPPRPTPRPRRRAAHRRPRRAVSSAGAAVVAGRRHAADRLTRTAAGRPLRHRRQRGGEASRADRGGARRAAHPPLAPQAPQAQAAANDANERRAAATCWHEGQARGVLAVGELTRRRRLALPAVASPRPPPAAVRGRRACCTASAGCRRPSVERRGRCSRSVSNRSTTWCTTCSAIRSPRPSTTSSPCATT